MSNQIYEKQAKKRSLSYSRNTFPMYNIWFNDLKNIHEKTFTFISQNIENYQKKFDDVFFYWLNKPKNGSKFLFEIKKKFMLIAEDILLQEIMIEQYRKNQNLFIIGPFQKYLEFIAEDDSPIENDINDYPDNEPSYDLLQEQPIPQDYNEEIYIDDNYYLSFFH